MHRISCPYCGIRDENEFTYKGAANLRRPDGDADQHAFYEYVYLRDNPRGVHEELWHHTGGCRSFVKVRRNTQTHEILGAAWPNEEIDA